MEAGGRAAIESVLRGAREAGRSALLESEVYRIVQMAGIPVPRSAVVPIDAGASGIARSAQALLEPPAPQGIVVKIESPDILHKTEVGGIVFASDDPQAIVRACAAVVENARKSAPAARLADLLLCERVEHQANIPGTECLLSLRQDPALGPLIVLGLGGTLTEWYGDLAPEATTWILSAHDPLLLGDSPPDIGDLGPAFALMVRPSRLHAKPPIDPADLWSLMRSWADLARTFGIDGTAEFVLDEVEINPLVLRGDRRLVALDGIGSFSTERPRVRRRRTEKIRRLLAPRSVAIIGASAKRMNSGRIILRNLLAAPGISRERIYPIHPKEEAIEGIPCLTGIRDLPERVDLAVVSVPEERAPEAIRELVEMERAHSVILIPGGFAERGNRMLADEIIESIEASRSRPDGGPVLMGGNCLGVVSKDHYNMFFLPDYKLPFCDAPGENLAMISQSGGYLVTFASHLDGVILPKALISYGNQMDLTVSDFMEHYLGDDAVHVIGCYIEGFEPLDGLRFAGLVREHKARGTVVIAAKAGRTSLGAQAAASHTASLAGDYAAARALLASAGALVAETLDDLEDLVKTFTLLDRRAPGEGRVAVISNAGFECSAAMDMLGDLTLAPLAEGTKRKLEEALPEIAHADNPIDATPMAVTEAFVRAVEALIDDPGVDVIVVSPIPITPALDALEPDPKEHQENAHAEGSLPRELVRLFRSTPKPIVASIDSGAIYDACVRVMQQGGIPTFRKIDRAMRAMGTYCRHGRAGRRKR